MSTNELESIKQEFSELRKEVALTRNELSGVRGELRMNAEWTRRFFFLVLVATIGQLLLTAFK